jgi:glucose-1-phosphate thymidylyltransferase
MQALILAGGEGKRLRPLTEDKPKGMVLLNGKPLVEHVLGQLPDSVTDIVIVTGYKGEKILKHFGNSWEGKPIHYVEQKEQLGTWHAVYLAKDFMHEKFIMLYGDDIGDKAAFTRGAQFDYCLFAAEREHPERYGAVTLNENGTLKSIEEKPEHPKTNLVSGPGMIFLPDAFAIEPFKHERIGEYLLTDLLSQIAREHPVQVVQVDSWITVTYPEDVAKAEELLKML